MQRTLSRKWLSNPGVAAALLVAAASALGCVARYQLRVQPLRRRLYEGMQLANAGRPRDAEREWLEALRIDRDYAPAWKMLGGLYTTSGRWNEARAALERVHQLAPREAHVLCRLATAEWILDDEKSAFRHAEEELRREPRCLDALGIGAQLAEVAGDQKKALSYLRRAAALQPNDGQLLFRLAMTLVAANQSGHARATLEHAVQLLPTSPDAHGLLGLCYLDDPSAPDHLRNAERHLTRALELEPNHPDALLAMGRLVMHQRHPREAMRHLQRAAQQTPSRQRVFFELARACEMANELAQAEQARGKFLHLKETDLRTEKLAKLCALEPNNFQHHLELGRLKLDAGDWRQAEHYLRRALALRPDDGKARKAWQTLTAAVGPAVSEPVANSTK